MSAAPVIGDPAIVAGSAMLTARSVGRQGDGMHVAERSIEKGLLIDFTKCIGCEACMVACREANGLARRDPVRARARLDQQQRCVQS